MRYFIALLLIVTGFGAQAANWYVRDGASGSGTSWSDAYDQLSSAVTAASRGDTIWVADGTYNGVTFNKAASGSTLITVKKATIADHGTETGWSDAYGDGQATFSDNFEVTTSYWLIDGVTGGGWAGGSPDKTPGNYGFIFSSSGTTFPLNVANSSQTITDVTLSHIASTAPTGDVEKHFVRTFNDTFSVNRLTVSFCYAYGYNNFTWGSSDGKVHDGWVHEHNVFLDQFCSSSFHGEQFNNNFSLIQNWSIRYNWVEGIRSGGIQPTMIAGALNNDSGPYYIYGNVFKDLTFADGGICAVNNGYGPHDLSGAVYNNTFINCESSYGGVAIVGGAGNNSMTVANNLFVDMVVYEGTSGTFGTNAYYNCSTTPTESGSSKLVLNVNPFVNQGTLDFHWAYSTNAGATLASTYNTDPEGVTRGADGNWDRGVFEYVAGGDAAPSIAITSPATPLITNNSSVVFTGTASDDVSLSSVTVTNLTVPRTFTVTGTTSWSATVTNAAGTNQIKATAIDSTNQVASVTNIVVYDATAPSVAITNIASPLITNNSSAIVRGTASDAVSLASIGVTNATVPRGFTVSGTAQWSATVTNAAGSNTINAIARDTAGTWATNSVTIVYDATAPTLSITSPTNGVTYSTTSVTLSNSVSDAIGLASVNSTNTTTGNKITLNGAYTGTATLQAGANTLLTIAQDVAGNRTTNSVSVTYTAPSGGGPGRVTNLRVGTWRVGP